MRHSTPFLVGTAITLVSLIIWIVSIVADFVDLPAVGEFAAIVATVAGIVGPLILLGPFLLSVFRPARKEAPPIYAVLLALICLGWTAFYVVIMNMAYCCCPDGIC